MPLALPHPLRRAGWLAGLPLLGAIWATATVFGAPEIAARIAAAGDAVARETEAGSPEPWLRVAVTGRDLVARGEAPGPAARAAVLARLSAIDGLRRVVSEIGLVETVSPFTWSVTRTAPERLALAGSRPAEVGRGNLRDRLAAAFGGPAVFDDAAHAARGAPPDFAAAAAYAVAGLRGLAPGAQASVSDTRLSFSGAASSVDAYEALRAAFAAPPEGYAIARADILPPKVDDFQVGMTRRPGGGLVLDGYVVSEEARADLVRLAASVADGAAVEDRMRTARGLPDSIDPKGLATFMTAVAGLLQAGRVHVDGGRVSVKGDAQDGQAIGEIEALVRDGRPAGLGMDSVTVGTRPLSPYRMAIRREGDAVSLSGHLPNAEVRDRVMALVRPRFFRESILDRTRLADGAPPDLLTVLGVTVPALASLAGGEIAIADRSVTVSGESLYREAATRLAETLPQSLPAGWAARVAVQSRSPAERREPDACRSDAAALVGGTAMRFPAGSVSLGAAFYPVLDALAKVARACPALRILVAGPGDPAKPAAPGPKPAEATVAAQPGDKPAPATTAPAKAAGGPGKTAVAGKGPGSASADKTTGGKPTPPDATAGKPPNPQQAAKADVPVEAPEPDLARQRALAIVEYLLQAGARLDQVSAADKPSGQPAVVFTLLP